MQERDAIAVIILFVFLVWVIAIIIGLRIVNKWVCRHPTLISSEQHANVLRNVGPKDV